MLTPAAAAAAILEAAAAADARDLAVAAPRALAALAGATLAEDVHAERDQPPFDRVVMDGVALRHAALAGGRRAFRVAGTQAAGAPPRPLADPEACVEVMTGAVLPPGTDSVVPIEQLALANGRATLAADAVVQPGQHVHRRGSDARAGERVLATGTVLRAPEVAILASAGRASVAVRVPPPVAVVSTGDELVEPGAPLEHWQVRRSNAWGLVAALHRHGVERVAESHLRDDPAQLRERLAALLESHAVLVLSGGVSAGRFDHVPDALLGIGVERVFHRVAQRPGKPLWFGLGRRGQLVFGLPGNPVSTLVCLVRYVLPALARLAGGVPAAPLALPLAAPVEFAHGLTAFLPVLLERGPEGATVARPRPTNGSGDFGALAGTDGFVELAPGRPWPRGAAAPLYAW